MKCPVCPETNLIMSDRQGVEIDYCPSCRGVWLDRGELDKIIDRSAARESALATTPHQRSPHYQQPEKHYDRQHVKDYPKYQHREQSHGYHHKKKKSFLSEMFDFD